MIKRSTIAPAQGDKWALQGFMVNGYDAQFPCSCIARHASLSSPQQLVAPTLL